MFSEILCRTCYAIDRLVCGSNDGRIQRRLLSESDLTYKRAFDLAQAIGSAERNAHDLQRQREEGSMQCERDPNRHPSIRQ